MALLDSEALILRSYNLAEADKIIVSLSRSAGLIRGVAKGSRKLRNRFGASLEPFTLVNLTWYEKENQELVSIRQTEILKSYFKLSSEENIVSSRAYMGDLLRFNRDEVDQWARQEAERRRAQAEKRRLKIA